MVRRTVTGRRVMAPMRRLRQAVLARRRPLRRVNPRFAAIHAMLAPLYNGVRRRPIRRGYTTRRARLIRRPRARGNPFIPVNRLRRTSR